MKKYNAIYDWKKKYTEPNSVPFTPSKFKSSDFLPTPGRLIRTSDDEAEDTDDFSWTMLYSKALKKMDDLSWLLLDKQAQMNFLSKISSGGDYPLLKKEIYECWLKLFDYCKFWLHYFDQGMKCAWIKPRNLIPLSMKKMKEELKLLMTQYYQTGR